MSFPHSQNILHALTMIFKVYYWHWLNYLVLLLWSLIFCHQHAPVNWQGFLLNCLLTYWISHSTIFYFGFFQVCLSLLNSVFISWIDFFISLNCFCCLRNHSKVYSCLCPFLIIFIIVNFFPCPEFLLKCSHWRLIISREIMFTRLSGYIWFLSQHQHIWVRLLIKYLVSMLL